MGKETFSIFGDSISTFDGFTAEGNRVYYESPQTESNGVEDVSETWWMQVIEDMGGKLLSNASFSGSMVSGCAFPAGCSMERAQQLLADGGGKPSAPSGSSSSAEADEAQPNILAENGHLVAPDNVLVFIGINDYGWGSAEAQIAGRSEAMPQVAGLAASIPEGTAGAAPDDALAEFESAYDQMLKNIRVVAPNANVWCATLLPGRMEGAESPVFCYQLRGKNIGEYNDVIRRAAADNGCHLMDIAALGYDYETTDGTHPTKRGMRQLAQMMLAAMKDEPSRMEDRELFPDHLKSARMCERASCIGCGYSSGTGNKWSLVCNAPII